MSNSKGRDGFEVGYGKPPKSAQFQKGRSGNPSGRPKGSLNVATVLTKTLRKRVTINENGRRETITKLQAAINQLVNQAASGDLAALRLLMNWTASAEKLTSESSATTATSSEADNKVLAEIVKRFDRSTNSIKGEE